ncbi:hypothetical protein LWI28_003688 [Acer negundo]|uniref:Reverse transcriptase RNase H-like domain-containing protein n=1 Tax=Acer negundo TaxID=4023 RepID=A0AAD5P0L3_ACENE|nr:hypothetical protein LWI28_003688 [Acer negundo]
MKTALTSPPVLQLPDFSIPFIVECDASGVGLGAILTQHSRPIAFYREALKGSALALSAYEKEMLAIVKAIRKWRPYLLGRPFVIQTDQQSLKFLLEQRITTPAQTRWLPKIMGYDYSIQYKRGKENNGADALSRVVEFQLLAFTMPQSNWWLPEKVWTEVSMDFIDGLPPSQGHTVVMVVVDRLSKYAHFVPLKYPYTAVSVSKAFVREIVRLHGVPIQL